MSQVRVRKIWVNENSEKNQVSVQVAEKAKAPFSLNKLAVVFQDLEQLGSGIVTAIVSMKKDVAERLFGTTDANYADQGEFDTWPTLEGLEAEIGEALAISVVENTTQNPNNPNQTPKINPSTGETLMSGGKPIFRHTELTTVSTVKREWLAADKVEATVKATVKTSALDAFGVVNNAGG